LVMYQGISRF